MKHLLPCLCALLLWLSGEPCRAQAVPPAEGWERLAPEQAGFDPLRFQAVAQAAKDLNALGGVVVWDGKIVLSWGESDAKGDLHSVRKSLVSALYGIALERKEIDPGQTLGQMGIDDTGGLSAREKQASVLDLLMARSGVYHEAAYETKEMKAARPARGSHDPGTFWYYNNWDFNVLGTILHARTGQRIGQLFAQRIAKPLGMQDFSAGDVRDYFEPVSIHPAYLFRMTARDMARFGLLYLRRGLWGNRQIVPAAWVDQSTRAASEAGPRAGYGYLWWVGKDRAAGGRLACPAYWASGYGGQAIVVIPGAKLVISQVSRFDATGIDSSARFWAFINLLLAARGGPCPG